MSRPGNDQPLVEWPAYEITDDEAEYLADEDAQQREAEAIAALIAKAKARNDWGWADGSDLPF